MRLNILFVTYQLYLDILFQVTIHIVKVIVVFC